MALLGFIKTYRALSGGLHRSEIQETPTPSRAYLHILAETSQQTCSQRVYSALAAAGVHLTAAVHNDNTATCSYTYAGKRIKCR